MKLYKFRSFDNIEYTLDILINERLYCSSHEALNDPFEGLFSTIKWVGGGIARPIARSIARPIARSIFGGAPIRKKEYKSINDLPSLNENIERFRWSIFHLD